NLIALMNLTMATLLAVFVAVKIVQALLVAANIVACVICAASLGTDCGDCEYLSSHERSYRKFVKSVDRSVADVNSSLHDTANVIARDIPALAARRGVEAGRAYAPMVEGAF